MIKLYGTVLLGSVHRNFFHKPIVYGTELQLSGTIFAFSFSLNYKAIYSLISSWHLRKYRYIEKEQSSSWDKTFDECIINWRKLEV